MSRAGFGASTGPHAAAPRAPQQCCRASWGTQSNPNEPPKNTSSLSPAWSGSDLSSACSGQEHRWLRPCFWVPISLTPARVSMQSARHRQMQEPGQVPKASCGVPKGHQTFSHHPITRERPARACAAREDPGREHIGWEGCEGMKTGENQFLLLRNAPLPAAASPPPPPNQSLHAIVQIRNVNHRSALLPARG